MIISTILVIFISKSVVKCHLIDLNDFNATSIILPLACKTLVFIQSKSESGTSGRELGPRERGSLSRRKTYSLHGR